MEKLATPKPPWLKVRLKNTEEYREVMKTVQDKKIHTVCEEAQCPNMSECWGTWKTASFMILGDTCTRRCRFCNVKTGLPGPVDNSEPYRVAEAVRDLGLTHAVITMVNRDDLDHGGSVQMAMTVEEIRKLSPGCSVELLSSDMMGRRDNIARMADVNPEILSHNLETVERLTPLVRSRSDYHRSLGFLQTARELMPKGRIKSSLMLGLGESKEELSQTMDDLLSAGVSILNMGQYLQPSPRHLPVQRFWTPDEFTELRNLAIDKGFAYVEAAPLVRSSYHAAQQLDAVKEQYS